jgi:HAD superfamily hydrolase (TIGR01509 family)
MNIIIPLGGKGQRFKDNNFLQPKPLINIFEKQMIFYVLDNITLGKDDKLFIIYYNLDSIIFQNIITIKYPNTIFIELKKQTRGAAETIFIGIKEIIEQTKNKKCMLLDCDTFYTTNIIDKYRNIDENAIFYNVNYDKNPIFSYIELDSESNVIRIKEKDKISDNANTGIYCFKDIHELLLYAEYVVENNITFNGENYTSCIIDVMIQQNHNFIGIELNTLYVYNLGTPQQISNYVNNSYVFLFDLDGTLVLTDDIYFDVWKVILINYNITLTDEIFKNYIQGYSDKNVLNRLFTKNIYENLIVNISDIKDNLFLKNIHKIKIIDGACNFLKRLKELGHKLGIVTNCNRAVAEKIVEYIKINSLIDVIIIGGECNNTKPHPEPYLNAIKFFNSSNERTIIFEDSKTGIQSGKNTFPKCLIGIETIYSRDELITNGVDITIQNYNTLQIDDILLHNNNNVSKISKYIKNSLTHLNITNIEILNEKLKGGFISDVLGVKIYYNDDDVLDCVLKLENKNETFLSKMANDLGLYEREYYFYDSLSKFVPVKIADFYGLIKDDNFNNIGILMNNLANLDYKLNVDLNVKNIDVSLIIIKRLAELHSKFWNKDLQKNFKELKKHNDDVFNPKWNEFIQKQWPVFKNKWSNILSSEQICKAQEIVDNFEHIQNSLSDKNLTLCHGDVKSANIFFDTKCDRYEPYFIDWQYICEGKGVQDLVFFMIESFEIETINKYKNIFKDYYYVKLLENGVKNYNIDEYDIDFNNSIKYFPFFVAIWFGTINEDELLDKNFPFFFIQRLFNFICPLEHS